MWNKNYILSKENGKKVLVKKFKDYKFFGLIIFLGFTGFGIPLIIIKDATIFGSVLIGLSCLLVIMVIPLKMKMTEYKNEFLIEKIYPLWVKKEFKINKKEKPIILSIKESPSMYDGLGKYNGGDNLCILKVSYNKNVINLYYSMDFMSVRGARDWSTPEQIREIAKFFNLPYKLIDLKGNLLE